MGNLDASFCHDLNQIAVGEPVGDVPADAQFDDLGLEGSPSIHHIAGDGLVIPGSSAVRLSYPSAADSPKKGTAHPDADQAVLAAPAERQSAVAR